jgi:hypothetical protein
MQVKSIEKIVLTKGANIGMPVIRVTFDKTAEKKDSNQVIDEVKKLTIKDIIIKGNLSETPEIKDLCIGLGSIGYRITFKTQATDIIAPLRTIPNIRFQLVANIPSANTTSISLVNLNLMKSLDEIMFTIKDVQEYETVKNYLKQVATVHPLISFSLSKSFKDDVQKFIETYLEDTIKFRCRNRLYQNI